MAVVVDLVFAPIAFSTSRKTQAAMQAFNQVVDTGYFNLLNGMLVTVASPDRSSMQVSESSFLADIFAS